MYHMTTSDLLKEAKLRYSTDKKPGFTRKVVGKKFEYFDLDGKKITEDKVIERINALAIPPAYKNVWICPYPNGYLQATGYDDKKRKQYRYHKLWNKVSSEEKFSHLIEFAKLLPQIRVQMKKDLSLSGHPRPKVIAAVVWLLENTLIRIGNEEYAQDNKSYGLTTLQNRHVSIRDTNIKFQFKGKSGVYHNISIKNKKVAKIVRRCRDLPGQDLFEYKDDEGVIQTVTSEDVNNYLKNITGEDITAKDFRTWGGTVFAASLFDQSGVYDDESVTKQSVIETVKKVAAHLRNKPNTCKKYYIHPHVITSYMKGEILSKFVKSKNVRVSDIDGLDRDENKVLSLLIHAQKAF
ncbi:MAG: DNA topoisomerase IB [Candidatus Levybacteria bacterium]|nr:DNA topoisomerase IB [Candidatus Levybacteria bacterium]